MKAIKLTEERINEILPDNVKSSTVVSENAKRVLAALLNHYSITPKAVESCSLVIDNVTLRESSDIEMDSMLPAIQELIELSLITRVRGKRRVKGEKSIASEYRFNIENINTNPIVRPTPEELLMRFFKM